MKIIKRSKGFTLIEIMVAVAILGILLAGIYGLYNSVYNNYLGQNQLSDVEQNARAGIEQMIKEIRLAAYQPIKSPPGNGNGIGIYIANASDFVFEEADTSVPAKNFKIEYQLVGTDLQRGIEQYTTTYASNNSGNSITPKAVVASNISALTFTYYDKNNLQLTSLPLSATDLAKITRVQISLTAKGNKPAPDKVGVKIGGTIYKQVQVEADIRIRNMGIGLGNADATPPAPPTGLKVVDSGNPCGSLYVSWNANTETDLAGYMLYYGTSPGNYTAINLGKVTTYTLNGLNNGTVYYVALKAYDTSANMSSFGSNVLNNGLPYLSQANTASDGVSVDTQPNVNTSSFQPAAPTINTATASAQALVGGVANPAKPFVILNWTDPSSLTGINGFNLYRSNNAGSTWQLLNGGTPIATTAASYTDSFPDSSWNCPLTYQTPQPYWYKMQSVDCGGNVSAAAPSIVHGSAGSINTYPTDNIAPADPTGVIGSAGVNQVYLGWTNPNVPDLFGVKILSNDNSLSPLITNFGNRGVPSDYPQTPTTGRLVYPSPFPPTSLLTPQQSMTFMDNGLINNTIYTYTFYAFDKCGNFSAGQTSLVSAMPCGDLTYPGRPGPPLNVAGSSCALPVVLNWNSPTINGDGTAFSIMPGDVVGFNVYRCSSSPCGPGLGGTLLNSTPIPVTQAGGWTGSWSDTTAQVGVGYYYAVTALDCASPRHESVASTTVSVFPGGLTQDVYYDQGTSTGFNSTTVLKDTTKNWGVNVFPNGSLVMKSGVDSGQARPVGSNTASTLTAGYPFTSAPGNDNYEIDRALIATTTDAPDAPQAHDDVKFFVKNTSTGPIQIRSGIDTAAITWSYPTNGAGLDHFGATALLKTIKIGTTTVWSGSAVTSGTNVTFSSTVNLSALQKGIPMELLFVNNGGSALSVDMTGESIGISMTYGTSTDGGSTFNNTCSWSTGSSSIIVSEGPVIKIKSLQMQTAITPLVYGVTSAGTYTLPPYTVSTYFSTGTVFTAGTPGSMISSAKVYYCKQSWSVMTSTPPPQNSACWTTSQPSLSPLSMTLTPNLTDGSANIDWSATKTAGKVILENGSPYRVWYYLQVTDNLGNISSEPVYSNGTFNAYTYDQYDGFVPGLTLTWSNNGSGPGKKSVVISGSVPDALGSTATTSGAAVSGTFQEVCAVGCSSYPFTTTLPLSNYTSGKVFTGTNDVIVTLTLTMAGFVTKNCTGDLPGNESSATLICP